MNADFNLLHTPPIETEKKFSQFKCQTFSSLFFLFFPFSLLRQIQEKQIFMRISLLQGLQESGCQPEYPHKVKKNNGAFSSPQSLFPSDLCPFSRGFLDQKLHKGL